MAAPEKVILWRAFDRRIVAAGLDPACLFAD
jgi:hypothetical protein